MLIPVGNACLVVQFVLLRSIRKMLTCIETSVALGGVSRILTCDWRSILLQWEFIIEATPTVVTYLPFKKRC